MAINDRDLSILKSPHHVRHIAGSVASLDAE